MTETTPAPLRGLVIDLDDTLVPWQTPLHWQWAWRPLGPLIPERHVRAVVRRQLHQWDRERWLGVVGRGPMPDAETYRRFLADTLAAIAGYTPAETEATAVVDRFLRPAHEPESFPDALALMRALESASTPVAIVSGLPPEAARWALRRAGLPERLLIPESLSAQPPSAAGFRAVAGHLGLKARELLYVGDLFWSDVRAAGRVGLCAVLIDRGAVGGHPQGPRIRSLSEVPELLRKPPSPGPEAPDAGPEPGSP